MYYQSITHVSRPGNLWWCCSTNIPLFKIQYWKTYNTEEGHFWVKHTRLIMCTTTLVNSHANTVQKAACVSERLWKLSKWPEGAQDPHCGSLVWLHSSSEATAGALQRHAGSLGTTPGGQLSTTHLAQPWLRQGDERNRPKPPSHGRLLFISVKQHMQAWAGSTHRQPRKKNTLL